MGIRSRLLEWPLVYRLSQNGIVKPTYWPFLAREVIGASAGHRILDIGCGTATVLGHLPEVEYLGVDHNPKYIAKARATHGTRGRFEVLDVNDPSFKDFGKFDRVLLLGVLHHLQDLECEKVMTAVASSLSENGRLITVDNGLVTGQHPIARFLAKADRGRFTREPAHYRRILESELVIESEIVRHDLLRVPYTHVMFRAKGSQQ